LADVDEVRDFYDRVMRSRMEGDTDSAELIANRGFTGAAMEFLRERRASRFVALRSLSDLLHGLIDFRAYLSLLPNDFMSTELSTYMVDLDCTVSIPSTSQVYDWDIPDDEYDSDNVDIADKDVQRSSVSRFILDWIAEPDSPVLFVLGDYGTGKTSLCQYLGSELAKRYQADPLRSRVPIIVPLRTYHGAGNAKSLITDWLINECDIQSARYRSFRAMLDAGLFVLFLDGFDEMTLTTHADEVADAFRSLSQLNAEDGKLVITGRPSYFPNIGELNDMILQVHPSERLRHYSSLLRKEQWRASPYKVVRLSPLSESQIEDIVARRQPLYEATGCTSKDVMKKLRCLYGFEELSRRPVLLDIIIRTFAELGGEFTVANTARLYELYTDLWIERERKKGEFRRLTTAAEKRSFMEHIAWHMLEAGSSRIHYSDLPMQIEDILGSDEMRRLDILVHDTQTCSFLTADEKGFLRFYHKSFMEYFAAVRVFRELQVGFSDALDGWRLTDEICHFLGDLVVTDDGHSLESLENHLLAACVAGSETTRDVSVWELARSLSGVAINSTSNSFRILSRIPEALQQIDLTGLVLAETILEPGTNMASLNLNQSVLVDIQLSGCHLSNMRVENARWDQIVVRDATADAMKVLGSRLSGCVFVGTRLAEARFVKSTIETSNFGDANLRGATIEQCVFESVDFSNCILENASFKETTFRKCDFSEAEPYIQHISVG